MAEKNTFDFSVWQQRFSGIDIPFENAPIKESDTKYIVEHHYPYIRVLNPSSLFIHISLKTDVFRTPFGFDTILYNNDVIFSSANYDSSEKENLKQGTIVNRIFLNAFFIVELAKFFGWPRIELMEGTDLMKTALWAACKYNDIEFTEYVASTEEEKKYKRWWKDHFDRIKKRLQIELDKSRQDANSLSY